MERRPPVHFDRRARVVSEHEYRVVKGRILSPPADPLVLDPRPTYRAEHVPPHDGGAHARSPRREELVVEPLLSAVNADHLNPATGAEDPFLERRGRPLSPI